MNENGKPKKKNLRRNGELNREKPRRKGKQNGDRSKLLKGRSVQGVVSSKLVVLTTGYSLLKYFQMNVLSAWGHMKMILLMVCWKKNGSSALTQKAVVNGCIATASPKMKMESMSAISAKSPFPDFYTQHAI